jgi:hypothetical protein
MCQNSRVEMKNIKNIQKIKVRSKKHNKKIRKRKKLNLHKNRGNNWITSLNKLIPLHNINIKMVVSKGKYYRCKSQKYNWKKKPI